MRIRNVTIIMSQYALRRRLEIEYDITYNYTLNAAARGAETVHAVRCRWS